MSITIGKHVHSQDLIENPSKILYDLSIKIYNKRQALLKSLEGEKVKYKGSKEIGKGILYKVDGGHCIVKNGKIKTRVDSRKLILL